MKRIKLTQNMFALVDDEWFDYLNQFKWQYYTGGYAARQTGGRPPNRRTIYMHRQIAGTPVGMDTDHINGDKLDNRSKNIRIVDHKTNLNAYMKLDKRNKSGYRGVSSYRGKWRARIGRGGYLGVFSTPEEAIKAIDKARGEEHGVYGYK